MNETKFILTNLRARINKVVSLMHSLTRGRAAQVTLVSEACVARSLVRE